MERGPSDPTVAGAVARFALAGVIALAIVGLVSVLVMRHVGTDEALKNAREVTRLVGKGTVASVRSSHSTPEQKMACFGRMQSLASTTASVCLSA